MKTYLIKLPDYNIIVSDEDIKEGDYCIDNNNVIYRQETDKVFKTFTGAKKLIASDNPEHNLPSVDYSNLNEGDLDKIGHVDIKKLINNYIKKAFDNSDNQAYFNESSHRKGFIEGFKVAQSLNDKKFSLEDVKHIINVFETGWTNNLNPSLEKVIKNLQQPKVFDIEIDNEWNGGRVGDYYSQPKITNSSIKITKIL